MTEQTASLPMLTRADSARFVPRSINEAERTVELVWSTGARVRRSGLLGGGFYEDLSMDDEAVDLSRLNAGAPLLDSHSLTSIFRILGVVESAHIQGPKGRREGRAKVRFDTTPEAERVWNSVKSGIIRNVSNGYIVHEWERIEQKSDLPIMRAVRWTPNEISLCPVPHDATAQVRSSGEEFPCIIRSEENATMTTASRAAEGAAETNVQQPPPPPPPAQEPAPQPQPAQQPAPQPAPATENGQPATQEQPAAGQGERMASRQHFALTPADQAQIVRSAVALRLPPEFAAGLIEQGITLDQAKARMADELARIQEPTAVRSAVHVQTIRDEWETRTVGMADALAHRALGGRAPMTDNGRRFVGMTLMEMARSYLEQAGVRTEGMPRSELAQRALKMNHEQVRASYFTGTSMTRVGGMHTTSDFPGLLTDTTNRTLRQSYDAQPRTFTLWARRATAPDLRDMNRLRRGNAGPLKKVREHGEYVRGTLQESKETYRVEKFGEIIGITEEAIINDDLNAFTDIAAALGAAAADTESDVVYSVLLANAAMADGTPLFHANHGNLAGTGTAIDIANVGAGFSAMAIQRDDQGNSALNIAPNFLLIPPALWTVAAQLTGAINPQQNNQVVPQPIMGLTTISEGRLQTGVTVDDVTYAGSAAAWYLVTNNPRVPTVEYAYLEGMEGAMTETQNGWNIDGMEVKVKDYFGAHAIEYRGAYKNVGP